MSHVCGMLFMFTALIRVSEAGFSDVLLFGVLFSGSFQGPFSLMCSTL